MVPQCRTAVKTGGLRKIYLTDTEDSGGGNQEDLLSELDSAKLQLRLKETERATAVNRNQELEAQSQKQKEELQKISSGIAYTTSAVIQTTLKLGTWQSRTFV